MKKKYKIILFIALLAFFLVGGLYIKFGKSKLQADAEKMANTWIEYIKQNDFDNAIKYYSADFAKKTKMFDGKENEELLIELKSQVENFGNIKSYKLSTFNRRSSIIEEELYVLGYEIEFSGLSQSIHWTIVINAPTASHDMKIVNFNYSTS